MNDFEKIFQLFEVGDYADCLAVCLECTKKYPGNYYPWFYKGKSEYELGDFLESIGSYRAALELAPDEDQLWGSLACALELAGKRCQALRAYRKEVELFPQNARGWMALASFMSRENRFNCSYLIFRSLEDSGCMDYSEFGRDWARVLYEVGTLEEELRFYQAMIMAGFDDDWVFDNYKQVVSDMGVGDMGEQGVTC